MEDSNSMIDLENFQEVKLSAKTEALALGEFQRLEIDSRLLKKHDSLDKSSKHDSLTRRKSGSFSRRKSDSLSRRKSDSLSRRKSESDLRLKSRSVEIIEPFRQNSRSLDRSDGALLSKYDYQEERFRIVQDATVNQDYEIAKCTLIFDSCADVCQKEECLDPDVLLPVLTRTKSENLYWDIRGIHEVSQDEMKPLSALARVNMRRKEKYENILKDIRLTIDNFNETISEQIRQKAEVAVDNIRTVKENVEQILHNLTNEPSLRIESVRIERIQRILTELNKNRVIIVETFCSDARKLEKQRTQHFKCVLQKSYKEMHEVMYTMPYDIQVFFEKKVQHLNQITINNYYCYAELEKKLKIRMEDELKSWFLKVKSIEFHELQRLIQDFEMPNLLEETVVQKNESDLKEEISLKLKKTSEDLLKLRLVADKLKYIESFPILSIFESYFKEMEDALDSLIEAGLVDQDGVHLDAQIMHDLSTMHCIDVEELEKIWSETIESMLQSLEDHMQSFSQASHIFDSFLNRMEEIALTFDQQSMILKKKNDRATMRMNSSFNLLVDALRQESTEENLAKTWKQITDHFQNIDSVLETQLRDEMSGLEKILQCRFLNTDILLTEVERFVENFNPSPESDPRVMKKRASWMTLEELKTPDRFFSKEFLNCKFIMRGISNWQFGLRESLILSMDIGKAVVTDFLKEWFAEENCKIKNRIEMKMKLNNFRKQGLYEDFYKVRLAELKFHDSRYKQHEMAVHEKIAKLNFLVKEVERIFKNSAQREYNKKVTELTANIKTVKKKGQIYPIIIQLKKIHAEALQEVETYSKEFTETNSSMLMDLRNSHLKFLESIKLFSENGNFSVDEVKHITKKTTQLEKLLMKEFSNNRGAIKKIYDSFVIECCKKFEDTESTLDDILQEFKFKEDVEARIKKLHRQVSAIVSNMKMEIGKFHSKIKSFREVAYRDENLGNHEWLFTLTRCFKEIMKNFAAFEEKFEYCTHIPPTKSSTITLVDKRSKRKTISSRTDLLSSRKDTRNKRTPSDRTDTRKSERRRSLQSNSSAVKMKRNYTSVLYTSPPLDNEVFLSKLNFKTYTSFCDLQDKARVFYENHDEVLDEKRVPSNFKTLIEEVLVKYKNYQLQYEFIWLEFVAEFCKLASDFNKFLGNYYSDALRKYREINKKLLAEKYDEMKEDFEKALQCIEEYYMSIHDTIKPMFGYPGMTKFLDIINEYMEQAEYFSYKTLVKHLEPSKEAIRTHCTNIEAIFLDMEKILICVRRKCNEMCVRLEQNLVEKTEIIEKILSLPEEKCPEECSVEENVRRRIAEYKKKSTIPASVKISYNDILASRSSIITVESIDFEEIIRMNFDDCNFYAGQIDAFEEKNEKIHDKFMKMWKQDRARVTELCKIRQYKEM